MRTTLMVVLGLSLALPAGAQGLDEVPAAERFVGDPLQYEHCTWVPAAARTLRVRDRLWATDIDVVNASAAPSRISIALLARGEDNLGARVAVLDQALAAGETLHLADVVDYVFERRWRSWFGGLVVCSESHPVEVSTRTALLDLEEQTSYGQGIPGLHLDEAVHPGSVGHLIGVREDEQYRTNIGLMNPLPGPIDVELRLVADSGRPVLMISYDLHPYGQVQLDRILDRYPIDIRRARIEVSSEQGPVFAYASMLDNASNDPTYLPCRVVPFE